MMDIKQFFLLAFVMLVLPSSGFAQTVRDNVSGQNKLSEQDSIAGRVLAYTYNQFAIARPFNLEYTYLSPYKYASKLEGTKQPESKATRFSQLRASGNFNLIRKKTWILGGTIVYRYTDVETDLTDPNSGSRRSVDGQFHYHNTSLNLTYFSRLFNRMAIYTGSLTVDGSEKHFERITGLATGSILLKANARTKMAVGLAILIDPSAQLPIIPIFTCEHKFNNRLTADIVLPRQLFLRKMIHPKGRLSLGTELDRTGFYLYNIDRGKAAQKYEYRQVDLGNGFVYEHLISNCFVVTAKTGMRTTVNSGLFEKEKKFGDSFFETTPKPSFYCNIGLSFIPHMKKKTTQ